MKKLFSLFILFGLLVMCSPADAGYRYESYFRDYVNGAVSHPKQAHNTFSGSLVIERLTGVPSPISLLKLSPKPMKGWYTELEGGKDILTNLFYPDDLSYTEADRGYFVNFRVKYSPCVMFCP